MMNTKGFIHMGISVDVPKLASELANEFMVSHPEKVRSWNEQISKQEVERERLTTLFLIGDATEGDMLALKANYEDSLRLANEAIMYFQATVSILGEGHEQIAVMEDYKKRIMGMKDGWKLIHEALSELMTKKSSYKL